MNNTGGNLMMIDGKSVPYEWEKFGIVHHTPFDWVFVRSGHADGMYRTCGDAQLAAVREWINELTRQVPSPAPPQNNADATESLKRALSQLRIICDYRAPKTDNPACAAVFRDMSDRIGDILSEDAVTATSWRK